MAGGDAAAVVGVLADPGVRGGGGVALGPAGDADGGQSGADGVLADPQGAAEGDGGQRVLAVEGAGEGDAVGAAVGQDEAGGQGAVGIRGGREGAHIGVLAEAEGGNGRAGRELSGHSGPARVVPVAHGEAALAEQRGLAGAVLVEVGVLRLADVVRGEVEEQGGGELQPGDPAQLHGLGGDLHDDMGAPGVCHAPQGAVEGDGFRRGVGGAGQERGPDIRTQGADHAGRMPGGGEDVPEHMGGGGLALGAGDGDERELSGRVAIESCGDGGQGGAGIVHGCGWDGLGQRRAADTAMRGLLKNARASASEI